MTQENIMDRGLKAGGAIPYARMYCEPYAYEGTKIEKKLIRVGIFGRSLKAGCTWEDVGQRKIWVEAFLETRG